MDESLRKAFASMMDVKYAGNWLNFGIAQIPNTVEATRFVEGTISIKLIFTELVTSMKSLVILWLQLRTWLVRNTCLNSGTKCCTLEMTGQQCRFTEVMRI